MLTPSPLPSPLCVCCVQGRTLEEIEAYFSGRGSGDGGEGGGRDLMKGTALGVALVVGILLAVMSL